ncbi:hypothetical protein Pa4123_56140 [Phytohabitans aurantiacus]|uniref:Uncharacterized protein n=1 Tax=Phytohabitans aurantiacus TaxID=3016789 RepID=A0ABQ5R188_9ACTN|nr:hypothetical protein Pa4123_56140 [Phytohabitans aurantiacus]
MAGQRSHDRQVSVPGGRSQAHRLGVPIRRAQPGPTGRRSIATETIVAAMAAHAPTMADVRAEV